VRLKGGDPFLFGRGSEEAEALWRAGIPFEVVPGIPSPLGATAYAGFSVTHRDLASSVIFVSGTTRAGKLYDFSELASVKGTICVLMGMHKLEEVVEALIGPGKRDKSAKAAIIEWGTRASQRVVEGRLDEIASLSRAAGLGSPGIILVGAVAELRQKLRWFDTRPLFGKRVLVLRPKAQAAGVSKLIRQRGGEAIHFPSIEIGDSPDPERVERLVRELGEYDVVAFTSENGVEKLFAEIARQKLDARAFGKAKIAAIGTGTASALAAYGIRADIIPTDFRGEGLAKGILEAVANQKVKIAIPRALVAREILPEMLRAAGCEVDVVPVYETRQASPERKAELVRMLEGKEIDIVMLSASSTAEALGEALGSRTKELLSGVLVASIGEITTETATKRGIEVAVTAKTSTMEGLVEAIEGYLAARPISASVDADRV